MLFELIFLACSLIGAFAIGLSTGWMGFRRRLHHADAQRKEAESAMQKQQEHVERMQGKLEALEERLAKAVDHERYEALKKRYEALEERQQALEERQWMGWNEASDEGLRFMESLGASLGVSITGEVPPEDRDALTQVRGISPYIEDRLNGIGIRTFDQLARLDEEQVRRVNEAIELLPGRVRRERWVEQCKALGLARKGA